MAPIMWLFYQDPPGAGTTLISYVDDGSIVAQAPSAELNMAVLRKAYVKIYKLMTAAGLMLEHGKTEVFHFDRSSREGNRPSLVLEGVQGVEDLRIEPKAIWRYLGFFLPKSG